VLYTISLQGPWYGNFSRELFCQYSYNTYRETLLFKVYFPCTLFSFVIPFRQTLCSAG
jgi:hypothetical protein